MTTLSPSPGGNASCFWQLSILISRLVSIKSFLSSRSSSRGMILWYVLINCFRSIVSIAAYMSIPVKYTSIWNFWDFATSHFNPYATSIFPLPCQLELWESEMYSSVAERIRFSVISDSNLRIVGSSITGRSSLTIICFFPGFWRGARIRCPSFRSACCSVCLLVTRATRISGQCLSSSALTLSNPAAFPFLIFFSADLTLAFWLIQRFMWRVTFKFVDIVLEEMLLEIIFDALVSLLRWCYRVIVAILHRRVLPLPS